MSKIKISKGRKTFLEERFTDLFSRLSAIERLTDTIYKLTDKKGECGLFSVKEGWIVLPIEFDRISVLIGNHLLVQKGNKFGIFSIHTLSLVLPVECEKIIYADSGLYKVTKDGRRGTFSTRINQLITE